MSNSKVAVVFSEDLPLLERRRLGWLQSRAESELTSDTASLENSPGDVESRVETKPSADRTFTAEQPKKKSSWFSKIDVGAFQFGLRMAVVLTFSSLFVLVRTPAWHYPDGMWVLVSVLFVCWFPALDAASVIEKILQRLIGTFVGAFLGLSCGFISILVFHDQVYQSIFIGFCMFLFCFLIIFGAGQCRVGRVKVIRRFAYATILCILTYCIALLPFATEPNPKYERALYRVMNVIVGCAVGALGSIVVCPKSTQDVLREKTVNQVRMAGDACEAVMELAADCMGGGVAIRRLADELINTPLASQLQWKFRDTITQCSRDSTYTAMKQGATDVALKKYEDAIADWKQCKLLFPLIKYDPFGVLNRQRVEPGKEDQLETARILARTLRIQTTVVMIDGMIRSDADFEFSDDDLYMFREIGGCIRTALRMPIEPERNSKAAEKLFEYLEMLRSRLASLRREAMHEQLTKSEREETYTDFYESVLGKVQSCEFKESIRDDLGRGLPKNLTESDENTLFFMQLIEHLVLRALRLYQSSKSI